MPSHGELGEPHAVYQDKLAIVRGSGFEVRPSRRLSVKRYQVKERELRLQAMTRRLSVKTRRSGCNRLFVFHFTMNSASLVGAMEWTNQQVLQFLELYEQEELLWNPKHENHKNRNLTYDAWKQIEMTMGIPLKILKKKKDVLLATYRKLAKKVESSKKSGCGTADVFEPTWFAYNKMSFLRTVYLPRSTINSEVCFPLYF